VLRRFFRWITIAVSSEKALYLDLKRIFGEYPGRILFYKIAFIHRSATKQLSKGRILNNERLEYLGDAVLNAIVADYLYSHFPDYKEGRLTQMRSKIVNHVTLSQIARKLDIDRYIISQPNVQYFGKYFYGDMVEALIGALFLDKGFKRTKAIVQRRLLKDYLDPESLIKLEVDFKSRVIEWCQKYKHNIIFNCRIKHTRVKSSNLFSADVMINGEVMGNGTGTSKKEAEQNAARIVWEKNILSESVQNVI
jgi:ribonuclease-3